MKKAILLLFLIFAFGCESTTGQVNSNELPPTTLSKAYPGDLSKVNKVELLDGSTGERVAINDREVIQEWLNSIKEIELIPDDNQELRVGFIYGITLYENEKAMLGFLPNEINHIYYGENELFLKPIKALFEQQFAREF